jgi:3-hydroxy-D-aspartate aldolase
LSIGMEKQEIDTPALLIDLDALERNIRTMSDYYRAKRGAALIPHQKGHRLPIIAKQQIDAGARGVSMTSLGLAEYYVQCGIDRILITAVICGRNKVRRLCNLSKQASITASVDDVENVRQISDQALANGTKIDVAVELYAGKMSCGVEFDKTKSFVKEIARFRGVNFKGLWYHGKESAIKTFAERRRLHFETLDRIARLKDEIEDTGIAVEMLSAGHTCTWNITPEFPGLSDVLVQAGSYVFSDWCSHQDVEGTEAFDYALTVLTRCISRPQPNEAMFDFGMNSCSDESGEDYRAVVGPRFKDLEGIEEVSQREEHALAILNNPSRDVRVGDVFELIPPHADTTAKLYEQYYGIRKDKLEVIWPNYGRGLL